MEGARIMAKYDKIVELRKGRSEELKNAVLTTIDLLVNQGKEVTIANVTRESGVSRSYVAHNQELVNRINAVHQEQLANKEKMPLLLRIKELEKEIQQMVPRSEYEELKEKYVRLYNHQLIEVVDGL